MNGLPKALEALLSTLLDSLELSSWQIFSEKQGACLKIRFKDSGHNQSSTVEPHLKQKWKKASPSQMKRDSNRSAKHNMVLRSRTDSEPEKPRCEDNEHVNLDISPVSVKGDTSLVSTCNSDINLTPSSVTEKEIRPLPTEASISEQTGGDIIPSSLDTEVDSDQETESSSESDVGGYLKDHVCVCRSCIYFDFDAEDPRIPYFRCTKCSDTYVCQTCINNGGHHGHQKYLVPYNSNG